MGGGDFQSGLEFAPVEHEAYGATDALEKKAREEMNLQEARERKRNRETARQRNNKTAVPEDQYRTAAERRAEGKALRDTVPREDHGGWKAPKDRRDPVELVLESNEGRMPDLVPIRHGRMLQSPFAFYRGTAAIMAADLAHTPVSGPRVQACDDAHLMNFGAFATPERNVIFDINDLDETLPAPWEWDLKRLAVSVVVAGRHLRLRENDSVRAARATVQAYREQMADYAFMKVLDPYAPGKSNGAMCKSPETPLLSLNAAPVAIKTDRCAAKAKNYLFVKPLNAA